MTAVTQADRLIALRRAATRATLAPSVHNTQPWRVVVSGDSLEIHADWVRRLSVIDPNGRQLVISCGCAVLNARVSLAASGLEVAVERFPDPERPGLLARLTLSGRHPRVSPLGVLDAVIELRQTNRRGFADDPVPADLLEDIRAAAEAEQVRLFEVDGTDDVVAISALSRVADRVHNADPAYRSELNSWTTTDCHRVDGIRAALRARLGLTVHPHIVLRVGRAARTPATPRRHVDDVVSVLR